jgi:predicted RecA/RadA family phage recombinase
MKSKAMTAAQIDTLAQRLSETPIEPATGGIASGDAIIVGSIFGIAAYVSGDGDPVELSTMGVFQIPKASAAVLAVGTRVAWDNTAKNINVPGTGRFLVGIATEAAGSGTTSVAVRLDGVATAAA